MNPAFSLIDAARDAIPHMPAGDARARLEAAVAAAETPPPELQLRFSEALDAMLSSKSTEEFKPRLIATLRALAWAGKTAGWEQGLAQLADEIRLEVVRAMARGIPKAVCAIDAMTLVSRCEKLGRQGPPPVPSQEPGDA